MIGGGAQDGISAALGTYYESLFHDGAYFVGLVSADPQADAEQVMPSPGTLSRFRVLLSGGPIGAGTWTFTVLKDGAPTAVTCSVSGTATACSDLVNTATFVEGDTISLEVKPTGAPNDIQNVRWTARYAP